MCLNCPDTSLKRFLHLGLIFIIGIILNCSRAWWLVLDIPHKHKEACCNFWSRQLILFPRAKKSRLEREIKQASGEQETTVHFQDLQGFSS